jgi:hypothetical protein
MEVSCSARLGSPYLKQLATSEIAAIFMLHPPMPVGSLQPTSQAIHEYISKANAMQSHIKVFPEWAVSHLEALQLFHDDSFLSNVTKKYVLKFHAGNNQGC